MRLERCGDFRSLGVSKPQVLASGHLGKVP